MNSFATNGEHEKKKWKIFANGLIVLGIMLLFSSMAKAEVKAEEITAAETEEEVTEEAAVSAASIYTVVVQDNYGTTVYTTSKEPKTVSDFFEEKGIVLGELDILKCELTDPITAGMVINIKRAEDVSFIIDGEEVYTIYMNVYTIGEALSKLKAETGVNYTLGEGYSSSQAYNVVDLIPVVSAYTKVETKIVDYYYDTETVENPNLEEGVKNVLTEGQIGSREVTIRVAYEDGKAVSTEILSEKILVAPVNKVIEIGTKVEEPEPEEEVASAFSAFTSGNIVRQLIMNASAYSIDYACTGKTPGMAGYGITASGIKAQYGVVAVDPRVIPLGTKLYVEGYGYCVAADTGGAIKGNKIDLCFNSYSEAVNYGRRNVTVYVLG
ncbi:MAG: G5 domain-containing protein [Clostridiales bacterium]|nr:G5 domain-containing protein [Clostridiales bacterium]